MRYVCVVAALFVAVALVQPALAAGPQEGKSIRGTVATLGGNVLTVKVGNENMVFTVEQSTRVVGPGGSTAMREARQRGQEGPTLSSLMKPGDLIQVFYETKGAANHATVILRGLAAPVPAAPDAAKAAGAPEPGTSVVGQVDTVGGSSLTITSGGKQYSFTVEPTTRVLGQGFGTMTREKRAAGEPTKLADFISKDDLVLVDYVQKGSALHAVEIHMLQRVK